MSEYGTLQEYSLPVPYSIGSTHLYRGKCINTDGVPPCQGCERAGVGRDCTFVKGNSIVDRGPNIRRTAGSKRPRDSSERDDEEYGGEGQGPLREVEEERRQRPVPDGDAVESRGNAASSSGAASVLPSSSTPMTGASVSLPSAAETEAIIRTFFRCVCEQAGADQGEHGQVNELMCSPLRIPALPLPATPNSTVHQIGFLHKTSFLDSLRNDPSSISPFLLFAILATSTRDCPLAISKHGGREGAAARGQLYFDKTVSMAFDEILEPSIDRIQAFYLLAQEDWMNGRGSRSWVFLGIAIRLCSLMGLELAETYRTTPATSPEERITQEIARRT